MAFETVVRNGHNLLGNIREDYGTFTTGDTNGEVRTRLRWIQSIHFMTPGTGEQTMDAYLNTQTTTENVAADGGTFHYANMSAAGVAIRFRALGR